MHKHKIFIATAKSESKGAKLDTDLKRLLSLVDGKTICGDLEKRAAPSLRKHWDKLLAELLKGGYIVEAPQEITVDRRVPFHELNPLWKGQVEARVSSEPAPLITSDDSNKNEVDARQKAEKAARAAELKAYFAAAKEKAKAEAKQAAQEAERARAELEAAVLAAKFSSQAEAKAKAEAKKRDDESERAHAGLEAAVAAAKARSDALAKAKAEARQKEIDAERARAELETAIAASKLKSNDKPKHKTVIKQDLANSIPVAKPDKAPVPKRPSSYQWRRKFGVTDTNVQARMRKLEIENEALKKLLTEAYMEIGSLKTSLNDKR